MNEGDRDRDRGHAPFRVLIPARLASTRLPNKPLADIAGVPMVVRVAQQAQRSGADTVVVAAADEAIVQVCEAWGVHSVLTDADLPSGTDRLAQAAQRLAWPQETIVVNVQGDEPLIDPGHIHAVAHCLVENPDCEMSTCAGPFEVASKAAAEADSSADFDSPHVVKVVCNARGQALYFSRAPIPHRRVDRANRADSLDSLRLQERFSPYGGRHMGLYAYRVSFLQQFVKLLPAPLEQEEALEQLRVLWHGYRIAVHFVPDVPHGGVDTEADLARVSDLFRVLL
jgi:3-deoxy-manno-octulosonate cytidylyltransferase (CMP-KDO synthetase)